MHVQLVSPFSHEGILILLYTAYRQSHTQNTATKTYQDTWQEYLSQMETSDEMETEVEDRCAAFIRKFMKRGHLSPLEHVSLTFFIDGISRTCSHQLVRHRLASYTQQSQRYVKTSGDSLIIPKSVTEYADKMGSAVHARILNSVTLYKDLVANGVPKEDARFFLPQAVSTSLIMTMNLREIIHFCNERLCGNAQWEIRELAENIRVATVDRCPWLRDFLVPKCKGYACKEGRTTFCDVGWHYYNEIAKVKLYETSPD